MQQSNTSNNATTATNEQTGRTSAKPYHTPSFTRLGKVEQLTGQVPTPTTKGTTKGTTKANKNGRAS